jgi:putative flippase GtrA
VAGQIAGALINVAAFVLSIRCRPALASNPIIPMTIGSALALIFNFSWANALVFRSRSLRAP